MRPVTFLLISLALASMASAQLGLGLGLGGLGLGLGRFGLLGGGLLGGIGLGSFGGLGGLGMFGRATFGGIRGKRDVDAITSHVTPAHEEINCILSKELLNCTGPHEIIQCPVEAHMPIDISASTHVKLTDLVFKDKIVNNTQILRIVPRKLINRMGHKLPNVSVYASKDLVSSEFGFRICDPTCFDEVVTLVKELPEKVKVTCAKDATD